VGRCGVRGQKRFARRNTQRRGDGAIFLLAHAAREAYTPPVLRHRAPPGTAERWITVLTLDKPFRVEDGGVASRNGG
jgi:hypothetical protein